ncbi:MAG: hypothetical protein KBT11_00395 [Treponema sp.]|nr:hypothetical protein [Candidatus Treponema equifaecale]
MKKILVLLCAMALLDSVVAAKPKKVAVPEKPAAEKVSKKLTKEEKAELRFKQNAVKDENLDILYMPVSSYEIEKKSIALKLEKKSFNILVKPEHGISVPVLSSVDNSDSSYFVVKIGNSIYNLSQDNAVKKQVRRTKDGAQLAFVRPELFQITVDFKLISSKEKEGFDEDAVQMTVYATNLSGKSRDISVKAVLDTALGENTSAHFITADGRKINNESSYDIFDFETMRYLLSSDGRTSSQIMLFGEKISPVLRVVVANPSIIKNLGWDEAVNTKRTFNHISSFNNSAVMIEWPKVQLDPKATAENTFFIFTAADDEKCRGMNYIDGVEPLVQQIKTSDLPENKAAAQPPAPTIKVERTPSKFMNVNDVSDKRTNVDFVVPPIKDYQLDPRYIQNLIDKIDSLQSDSGSVNKNEIQRLNAELDAILAKLRQQ